MRKFFSLAGLFFFITFHYGSAQQWQYHNPTLWFDVNSVEIPGPGIIAIGGGWETQDSVQIMFQTEDYGATWYENTHDGLAPWNKSIAFSDALNGCAAGYDGRIVKTDDAGRNWGWAAYPTNRDLNKIVYAGSGTYYVAGGNKTQDSVQTILKSSDYGDTWTLIYDTLGPWLRSLYFFDTLRGIAVGDGGVILSTADGGDQWSSITAPIIRDFYSIKFINADTGYIVGGNSSGYRTVICSVDGGLSWSVLIDTVGGMLKDLSFANMLLGYAVGDSATVLKTMDGGQNWVSVLIDSNLVGNEIFNAVRFYDQDFGVIGGKAGRVYIYVDQPSPLVQTHGAAHISLTQVELHAFINTLGIQSQFSFYYSSDSLFTTYSTTNVQSISSNSFVLVSDVIDNLIPETDYYYFIKASNMTGSVYGDTNSFGVIPFSVLATHDAVAVTDNSAILKGVVDHAITNTNLFFQFDTTLAFANEVQANPMQVSDTLVHYVYALADSLIHDKIYYFRIKGVTQGGTYYGNIKTYYTGTLYDNFETIAATNITPSSATLNAIVDKFMTPVKLEFEYGETLNFDHIISAVPDSIIDTMQYQVTADITSLLPDKFYYYRLKGISGEGVIFSNTNSLFTGNALYNNFTVTPATDITDSTVTLNGVAEGFKIPAQVYFEVGKSPDVGDWVFTNPDTIVDSTTHIIWGKSVILSPSTKYYFRLVAQTDLGIIYSNLLSFNTAMSAANFQALLSTEVTSNSARFNGKVKNLGFSPDIYFEYGTDQSFGYELPAVPGYINNTLEQNVSCQVTGLQLHTFYYYRMKAVFGGHSYFSNTQKVFIADCAIPNCGFELWNTVSKDFPDGWTQAMGDVSKYSPGYNSNYAVKIQNTPEGGLSALTIGYISDGASGGVPFNARPDSLVGCFNYNISLADTAWLGLFLKKNGQIISLNLYNIVGTTGGNFAELKFPVHYDTPETPDSLMMMILCSNLNDYIYLPENWIIVDNIRFIGTTLTVPNNDFENWHIETGIDLANWYYNGKNRLPNNYPQISEIERTTDAAANNFSVKIQNIVMPFYETQGRLSYGTEQKDKFPVYGRHHSLTGLYKFFPENGDTMSIHINLYKNGEIIGFGKFIQNNIVDTYSPLITEIKYNYSPFEIPDSASISIQSYFNKPRGRSVLYIDNLSFDGFLSGIKESPLPAAENINFNVYPNPFTENATISFTLDKDENVLVRLFDLSGKQIAIVANGYYKPGEYKINLSASGLNKGFYICVINTSQSFQSRKLVIY